MNDKITLAGLLEVNFELDNAVGGVVELTNGLHDVAVAAIGMLETVKGNGGLSFSDECCLTGLQVRLKGLEGELVAKPVEPRFEVIEGACKDCDGNGIFCEPTDVCDLKLTQCYRKVTQ